MLPSPSVETARERAPQRARRRAQSPPAATAVTTHAGPSAFGAPGVWGSFLAGESDCVRAAGTRRCEWTRQAARASGRSSFRAGVDRTRGRGRAGHSARGMEHQNCFSVSAATLAAMPLQHHLTVLTRSRAREAPKSAKGTGCS